MSRRLLWFGIGLTTLALSLPPAAVASSPAPGAAPRIVGGSAATQGQWPFMAEISYRPAGSDEAAFCSGTVLSANVILTAGHCTVDTSTWTTNDPAGYTVVTGASDWTNLAERQVSRVQETIPYPHYDPGDASADLGLLVLATPISAPTIALPSDSDQSLELEGTEADIAGWGETYQGSGASATLYWGQTAIQSSDFCAAEDAGGNLAYSPSTSLCALDSPALMTGACEGDSGGPLFRADATGKLVELGIVSFGSVSCSPSDPSYFTATLPFAGWIEQEIAAVAPPPGHARSKGSDAGSRLTPAAARADVKQTLRRAFGSAFRSSARYSSRCRRRSASTISCAISFRSGGNDYRGTVTIQLVGGGKGASERYVVRWAPERCSARRGSCRAHTKRGSA
jgi:secreted trypsin-like serine protease